MPTVTPVADIEGTGTGRRHAARQRHPGMTVAVGAGSRASSRELRCFAVRSAAACRALGAEPFVVPAMGSHGGATAEGQRAMLESLGMTEETIGCEIRATMETIEVARTGDGMPLYLDRNAAGADRIMPVNRIKPHTCFKGPIESGLTKMSVVGFGKQPGAAQIHACGPVEMRNRILNGIAALKKTGRLLGGVGTLESADGQVVDVRALTGEEVGGDAEIELTDAARDLVPPLPFPLIDVLIIEEGGKDISGTTMDPNVTGRFWVQGLGDLESPRVSTIVLLGITEVSGGNVLGIGFADFIPSTVAAGINWQKTYVNCFALRQRGHARRADRDAPGAFAPWYRRTATAMVTTASLDDAVAVLAHLRLRRHPPRRRRADPARGDEPSSPPTSAPHPRRHRRCRRLRRRRVRRPRGPDRRADGRARRTARGSTPPSRRRDRRATAGRLPRPYHRVDQRARRAAEGRRGRAGRPASGADGGGRGVRSTRHGGRVVPVRPPGRGQRPRQRARRRRCRGHHRGGADGGDSPGGKTSPPSTASAWPRARSCTSSGGRPSWRRQRP